MNEVQDPGGDDIMGDEEVMEPDIDDDDEDEEEEDMSL